MGLGRIFIAIAAASLAPISGAAGETGDASQKPPKIPTLAFAKDNGISRLSLSPDGSLIAAQALTNGKVVIAVLDAATRQAINRIDLPEKTTINWFKWAGNAKLLVSLSAKQPFQGEEIRISRLFYFDTNTRKMSSIGNADMGVDGDDVIYTDPAGDYVLLSMQRTIYEYPSVWKFMLDANPSKSAREVQKAKDGVWDWVADTAGVVRLGIHFSAGDKIKVIYRKSADEDFRMIAKLNEDTRKDGILDVLRIVSGSDQGIVLKEDASGRVALRKFDYATRTPGETIFAADGWDVTSATFDANDQLVAAFYTDDRDRVVWFDPKMKAIQARLEAALKGNDVWVTSRAKDSSRMIVWGGHEGDAGSYFLYTPSKKSLDAFLDVRPELPAANLSKPEAISYVARDGTKISGYLTLPRGRPAKGLPLIILPHGGPFHVRDKLTFSSEVQMLANRGYAVLQPNFRGSDGYGEAFDKLGRGQIGRTMQDDLDDGMDWLVKDGTVDAKRVCVVGSSYGGYAALWAVTRNPERYRCAASFAGVTDWKAQLKYDAAFFNRTAAKKWRKSIEGSESEFDLDLVSPTKQIAQLSRPVLITHGTEDNNVPFKQFTLFQNAAKKAGKAIETVVFEGEGHGFDDFKNEAKWYDALDAFLANHNPAD